MTDLLRPPVLVGESPAVRRAAELVARFAPTPVPILLVGATGTGKELLARHVHTQSGRAGRFVPVNCGALPRDMAESLLFGHRRGAFSSAVESRRGYVECADRGTLFLDELSSLPLDGQAKLLRALDTGEIQPLGEEHARVIDARVVAAFQHTLSTALDAGDIRYDLFHRVAGVVIPLPPLAERSEDIVPLARHFAALQGRVLMQETEQVLISYAWPGNVRELRQVIDCACRLVLNELSRGAIVEAMSLGAPSASCSKSHTTESEDIRKELLAACRAYAWNAAQIAHALGISRATLFRRLRACRISLQWPHVSQTVSRLSETQ